VLVYRAMAGVASPRSNAYAVIGQYVVFTRGEAEDANGGQVLNGDGDTGDGVITVLDTQTGIAANSGISADVTTTGVPGEPRVLVNNFGCVAWLTREVDEGEINNDGDPIPNDTMISFYSPALPTTPATNVMGGPRAVVGQGVDRIVVSFSEADQGPAGADQNGDLDAVDTVFAYLDLQAFTFDQTQFVFFARASVPVSTTFANDQGIACALLDSEASNINGLNADPNGDIDSADTELLVVDLAIPSGGAPNNYGWAGTQAGPAPPAQVPSAVDPNAAFDASSGNTQVAYYIDEVAAAGADQNADGDAIDLVPAYWDFTTQVEVRLALAPGVAAGSLSGRLPNGSPQTAVLTDPLFFFTANEQGRAGAAAGSNNDGDGGTDAQILYWTDTTIAAQAVLPAFPLAPNLSGAGASLTALALDGGGSARLLTSGWLAVIVNEGANGNLDINGNGTAGDMAYLLVDTTQAQPVVHLPAVAGGNTGLAPSDSTILATGGNIPITGVADPSGVVLRLTETQNGNLDGDGNTNETLLAFIDFGTPGTATVLDVGGDYCAMKLGTIAVTANEAYTSSDYNNDADQTDFLLRIVDFLGGVVEPGTPCARTSIPASDVFDFWVYLRDEVLEGMSLNGDGDALDLVLGIWTP